jgi:hypothetical protein
MHRALDIVELVENICAHLAPADLVRLKTDTARDLALLSRTSTIFLDPALDVLWRSQDSLIHLLRCMPDDLLEIPVVPPDPERRYSHGRSPPAPPIVRILPFSLHSSELKTLIAPPATYSSDGLGTPPLLHAQCQVFQHGTSYPLLRRT